MKRNTKLFLKTCLTMAVIFCLLLFLFSFQKNGKNVLPAVKIITIEKPSLETIQTTFYESLDNLEVAQVTSTTNGEEVEVIVEEPATPVKAGYVFLGWYYLENSSNSNWIRYDFDTPVRIDYDLHAKWVAEEVYNQDPVTYEEVTQIKNTDKRVETSSGSMQEITRDDIVENARNSKTGYSLSIGGGEVGTALFLGIIPLLLIILFISIYRDIKVALWYRQIKAEALKKYLRNKTLKQ